MASMSVCTAYPSAKNWSFSCKG